MSLNKSIPKSKKRLGYGLVSESSVSPVLNLQLTVTEDCSITTGHHAPDRTPPPPHSSCCSLKIAPTLRVRGNHHTPPLPNRAHVLAERLQEPGELWWSRIRDVLQQSEAMILDYGCKLDGMLKQQLDLFVSHRSPRTLTC